MKKLLSIVVLGIIFVFIVLEPSALAADLDHGTKIFKANCNACHAGGKNSMNPRKTLAKSDLEKYSKFSVNAIMKQVKNGAGAMPSFKRRLKNPKDIEDVAAYVLAQAEKGWK